MNVFFNKIIANVKRFFKEQISLSNIIALAATSFVAASIITLSSVLVKTDMEVSFEMIKFLEIVPRGLFMVSLVLVFAILLVVSAILATARPIYITLAASTVTLSSIMVGALEHDIYFNFGIFFVIFTVFTWLCTDDKLGLGKISFSDKTGLILVTAGAIVFTVYVGYHSAFQYLTYTDATFDFGIFAQMFDMMKKTGLPITSIERSEVLSHFAVHFSPVYYLLLPGYLIFSSPVYLYVMQALVIAVGAFAVYLISKKLGFSPMASAALSYVYLLFPTMSGGCFYDFHENKFLSVFVLFLVYFILSEKPLPIFIFALLLLSVKEDAAIYLASIALFVILARKGKKMKLIGSSLLLLSVVYFFFATNMIETLGGNPMITRLSDYYNKIDGNGFSAVVKTIFYDIGYLIRMCFTATYKGEPVAGKIVFILWMFLPLVFTPFFTEKISTFVLLIPMGVINLMQSWPYQYNIDFQYTYGSAALAIFMAILAISAMKNSLQLRLITTMAAVTLVFFVSVTVPKANYYREYYTNHIDSFKEVTALLADYRDEFESASVTASDYFTPHLYYVEELEALYYYNNGGRTKYTDYFVVHSDYLKSTPVDFIEENYELVDEVRFLQIYKIKEGVRPE